jgi:hypothetical protein
VNAALDWFQIANPANSPIHNKSRSFELHSIKANQAIVSNKLEKSIFGLRDGIDQCGRKTVL